MTRLKVDRGSVIATHRASQRGMRAAQRYHKLVLITLTPTVDLDLNLDLNLDVDLDIDLDLEPQKITLGLMLTSRCGSRFRCRFRFGKLKTCWQDHNKAGIHLHSTHCRFQGDTQVELTEKKMEQPESEGGGLTLVCQHVMCVGLSKTTKSNEAEAYTRYRL